MRLCTEVQVSSSTRFGGTLGCTPKFWGVTWPRPRPFSGFSFVDFWDIAPVHLRTKFQVSTYTRYEYTLGATPKILGVTWPRPRPFSGFFFAGFWDIAPTHRCAKFQVSSSTRFGDTLGCSPKFWGSRDPGHAPFLDFSLRFLRHCHSAFVHQIWSLYIYSFWRYVRVYAKIYDGHMT